MNAAQGKSALVTVNEAARPYSWLSRRNSRKTNNQPGHELTCIPGLFFL